MGTIKPATLSGRDYASHVWFLQIPLCASGFFAGDLLGGTPLRAGTGPESYGLTGYAASRSEASTRLHRRLAC
jgi:hypothetical protein